MNKAELQTADQMKRFREASYDKHKYSWVGSAWNNDCKVAVTHPRLRHFHPIKKKNTSASPPAQVEPASHRPTFHAISKSQTKSQSGNKIIHVVLKLMHTLVIPVVRCEVVSSSFRDDETSKNIKHDTTFPDNRLAAQLQTGSSKHGKEAEIAELYVDCSKRRTARRACSLNQGWVHILRCLLFFLDFFFS